MSETPAPSVLLVEDNEDNRIIYSTMLAHAGYRVLEARDGETAIVIARKERPDLILMDISIPLLDGHEATRVLRANPATSTLLIVALTAHALPGDRERALEAGANHYLSKPIEPRALMAEIARFLREARAPSRPRAS